MSSLYRINPLAHKKFLLLLNNEHNDFINEFVDLINGEAEEAPIVFKYFPSFKIDDLNSVILKSVDKIESDEDATQYSMVLYSITCIQGIDITCLFDEKIISTLCKGISNRNILISLFNIGTLYNMCLINPEVVNALFEHEVIDHIQWLLIYNERYLTDEKLFINTTVGFIDQLITLILQTEQNAENMSKLWSFSFSLISEHAFDIKTLMIGFELLSKIIEVGYKEEISEEQFIQILQETHENVKVLKSLFRFIRVYNDETLVKKLIEGGLFNTFCSILEGGTAECSAVLEFLISIDYIPEPDEPLMLLTLKQISNKMLPIRISVVKYLVTIMRKRSASDVRGMFKKLPLSEISEIIDDGDLSAIDAALSFVEISVQAYEATSTKIRKTVGLMKIIPALENAFGINEEFDERINEVLEHLEKI